MGPRRYRGPERRSRLRERAGCSRELGCCHHGVDHEHSGLGRAARTRSRQRSSGGMLTAEEYRQSIRDGRASYLEGRRIEDPVTNPLLAVSVDWVASTYERTGAAGAGGRNPIFDLPATPAELDEQM